MYSRTTALIVCGITDSLASLHDKLLEDEAAPGARSILSRHRNAMKCNSCWQNLEGRAIATTCGHVFCPQDASRILKSDATCPMCDQLLSKR